MFAFILSILLIFYIDDSSLSGDDSNVYVYIDGENAFPELDEDSKFSISHSSKHKHSLHHKSEQDIHKGLSKDNIETEHYIYVDGDFEERGKAYIYVDSSNKKKESFTIGYKYIDIEDDSSHDNEYIYIDGDADIDLEQHNMDYIYVDTDGSKDTAPKSGSIYVDSYPKVETNYNGYMYVDVDENHKRKHTKQFDDRHFGKAFKDEYVYIDGDGDFEVDSYQYIDVQDQGSKRHKEYIYVDGDSEENGSIYVDENADGYIYVDSDVEDNAKSGEIYLDDNDSEHFSHHSYIYIDPTEDTKVMSYQAKRQKKRITSRYH
ncbi:hypothetical protein TRFO_22183 [Tritrichomonas foetus]|uniref:Uncharacterized protein n=1 Tax=Tritrichomonas foetus TaxID=1144522 RepID=A0A1J4KC86_9EUKA|nr:hypothetical protein TRFO_22183 [Tritrichomonas foetus]|eukprot:OHT09033.1 hypothetical protein TRFO_22183 [Tritrichomonas foetus]